MAADHAPPLTSPQERKGEHTLHTLPSISATKTYASLLQDKNTTFNHQTSATIKAPSFTPFSVNSETILHRKAVAHPNFVFGDFAKENFYSLKPHMEYCGKKAILFQKSDKVRLINRIQHVLIGKFSHGRPPITAIKEFFGHLKLKGYYNISLFDSKHMYIECELSEDYKRIWLEKLWIVKGFQMRVFKWTADFNPRHELPVAPVWVYLYGLPLYFFEKEALLSIANAIGSPLLISKDNLNRSNLSFASLCVEIDVTKPLLDEVWIDFGKEVRDEMELSEVKRDGFWQKLEYGFIPSFCTLCSHLDHSVESCKQRKNSDPGQSKPLKLQDRQEWKRSNCHGAELTNYLQAGCSSSSSEMRIDDPSLLGATQVDGNEKDRIHLEGILAKNLCDDVPAGFPEAVECNATLEEEVLIEDISLEEGEIADTDAADGYHVKTTTSHMHAVVHAEKAAVNAQKVSASSLQPVAAATSSQHARVPAANFARQTGATTENSAAAEETIGLLEPAEQFNKMVHIPELPTGIRLDKKFNASARSWADLAEEGQTEGDEDGAVELQGNGISYHTAAGKKTGRHTDAGSEQISEQHEDVAQAAGGTLEQSEAAAETVFVRQKLQLQEPSSEAQIAQVGDCVKGIQQLDGMLIKSLLEAAKSVVVKDYDKEATTFGKDKKAKDTSKELLAGNDDAKSVDLGLIEAVLFEQKGAAVLTEKEEEHEGCWADLVEEEHEQKLAREHNDILEWDAAQVKAFVHKQIEEIKQEIGQIEPKIRDAAKEEKKEMKQEEIAAGEAERVRKSTAQKEKQLARELKFVRERKNLKEYFRASAEKINSDFQRKRSEKKENTTRNSFKYGEI